MNPFWKLVKGDNLRSSRLHTDSNVFCGLSTLNGYGCGLWRVDESAPGLHVSLVMCRGDEGL